MLGTGKHIDAMKLAKLTGHTKVCNTQKCRYMIQRLNISTNTQKNSKHYLEYLLNNEYEPKEHKPVNKLSSKLRVGRLVCIHT